MIERCDYCGEMHEVERVQAFNGMELKTCPKVPRDEFVLLNFNPIRKEGPVRSPIVDLYGKPFSFFF